MPFEWTVRITICILLWPFASSAQDASDLGKELFLAEDYEQAKVVFERILEVDPDQAAANYFLGRIYLRSNDPDTAQGFLEKAVEVEGRNVEYRLWLARVYGRKTRTASFLAAAKWAGRWLTELGTAFAIDPEHIEARKQLFQYYLNAPAIGGGDKKKAMRLAEETVDMDERVGHLLLAEAYGSENKLDLAVAEYKRVLELDPGCPEACKKLGYIFLKRDEYEASEATFRMYINTSPGKADPYDCLGDCYSKQGRVEDAIRQFATALEKDPGFSHSRFKLGKLSEEKGLIGDAIEAYETSA
jgi:tetratricopeptide (TPR) repeat protein